MANKSQSKKMTNLDVEPQSSAASTECPFVKQATEAFLVFDAASNESVDVREVGTIIRSLGKHNICSLSLSILSLILHDLADRTYSLTKPMIQTGCCPSESELQHLVTAMEGDGTTQFITLQKFAPMISGILQQKRYVILTE